MNTINEFCVKFKGGTLGVTMVTITDLSMNKKNNPYYGRVKKATYLANFALGCSYEKTVGAHLEREGIDAEFKAKKPNGLTWIMYPYILQSDKNPSQLYLRIGETKNMTRKSVLICDGQIVRKDSDLYKEIYSFAKKNDYVPKTQTEAGLTEDTMVKVQNYKIENVYALKQGDLVYIKKDGYDITRLRTFFGI